MKRIRHFSIWLIALIGLMSTTDISAKAHVKYLHYSLSVVAGKIWSAEVVVVNPMQGETFTYQWQGGYEYKGWTWVNIDDNDVYIGTKTKEFGFRTTYGKPGFGQMSFRCVVTGSKSGVMYSDPVRMRPSIVDITPPTPGSYEAGYPKAISPTDIKVKWTRATDDVAEQSELRYVVAWKKRSEAGWHHSHEMDVFEDIPKDMTSYTITGLERNTEYEIGVSVWDNLTVHCTAYSTRIVKTLINDNVKPTPGVLSAKAISSTEIEVKWTHATDDMTPKDELRYVVKWKKKGASGAWSRSPRLKDESSYVIEGLEPNTEYEIDGEVLDKAGNLNWYSERIIKTHPMPTITLTPSELTVSAEEKVHAVKLSSDAAFCITGYEKIQSDWIKFSAYSYSQGKSQDFAILVKENKGGQRTGSVTIKTTAGNKTLKVTQKAKGATSDTENPTPGGYEAGYPKAISATEIEVKWARATDNQTPQANLRYAVKWKKNGSLSVWKHSPITKDMTSYTLTGLEPKTIYIVNVVVEDEAGNSKWYGVKTVKTQAVADKTPPVFNAGAKLNVDNVTETSVILSWPPAKDDQTPEEKMKYRVQIVNNGIYKDMTKRTATITKLIPDKTYHFWVRAGDEAGNWNTGITTEVTTKKKEKSDTERPYFPNGQALSVTATETSLSFSWPAAADKVTATSNLKYTLFFKRSGESVWPGTRLGKNVLKHTRTGLLPDTEYDICVTVYDEAANGADYTWALKTKTKASVKTVHPASVTIAPASFDLEVGNKAMPTATVLPINAADKTVTWSSNNTAVASVDPTTGEVTALAPGKAEITATANDKADGTIWNTIEVRVKAKAIPKLVTGVAVMPAAHILNVGDIFYYIGIVKPDDATDKGLTWTSSDPTVATITSTGGFVNALQAGTVTITATAKDGSGRYGTGTLTIKNPSTAGAATSIVKATGIVVDQPSITLAEGGTATLSARILPSDATNKGYTWSSSDPEVASVSNDGVVTAHRAGGSALITATADDGGWTDFCAIHIKGTSVMLAPSAFTLEPGESLELKATTDPWDSPMTKSFSSNRPSVAQVDKGGMVKAVAEGEAIITVTLSGGQKATCRISVQKSGTIPDANETIVDQSAARAWTANGTLYIVTDKPADVEVLNFSGLRLKKLRAPAGTTTVSHLPQGLYIVRVGERTTKVMVK